MAPKRDVSDVSPEMPCTKRPKYKLLTEIEHVLQRPGMYVGPVTMDSVEDWGVTENLSFVRKNFKLSRALVSICNELLVNAKDVVSRFPEELATISLKVENEWIKVINKGASHFVDVVWNHEHQLWTPELVFTEFRSGSNFDDTEERLTGGQNGLGSKLAFIFSLEATIEVGDPVNKKSFFQRVSSNLKKKELPRITSYHQRTGYVSISIRPDTSYFGMESLHNEDFLNILKRRCFELSACTPKNVSVEFQGQTVPCRNFKEFAGMFGQPAFVSTGGRWNVAVFNQPGIHFSIVNGINTRLQGSHVKHVEDKIISKALPKVQEKVKDAKPSIIRDNISLVVACDLVNPSFTSQAKEELSMPVKNFGSAYIPSDNDLAKLLTGSTGLIARAALAAISRLEKKATDAQAKTSRKAHLNIPKLDDAIDAGTRSNHDTILQVTEGDSAKVVALRGIEVLGRKKLGAYPLRGKLLNAMKATKAAMLNNKELKTLCEILGLRVEKQVSSLSDLRYTSLMIVTDADPDGKHIAGLIMCFIATFWPELLSLGFVTIMLTPVVKATHRRTKSHKIFYDLESYHTWQNAVSSIQEYDVRFYKGLGTSTAAEAKGYYHELKSNLKRLKLDDSGMDALKKMFQDGKDAVAQRKEWIGSHVPICIDYLQNTFSVSEYVNHHVMEYCLDDISRSLPAIDGFKISQRKVIWSLLQRSHPEKPMKVCQLSGYVAERSCYHHGEASLNSTIIHLNQDFVGKNQVPLLHPHSNFGTRLQGGADASQPRYIDTSLAQIAKKNIS